MTSGTALAGPSWSAALEELVVRLGRTDLRPGPVVDVLFSRLVAMAFDLPADDPVLDREPLVAQVRDLAARGESELEAHWAALIRSDPRVLRDFPYLWNYLRLARGEWEALRSVRRRLGRPVARLAFVGSGPLPLSALALSRLAPDVALTCIDRDPAAVALGRGVARSVGAGGVRFVAAEAVDVDYSAFDVVVVAALVGATVPEKASVLDRIARSLSPGAVLGVRSVPADGRRLLYARVDVRDLPAGVRPAGEWLPPSGVVNSLQLAVAG